MDLSRDAIHILATRELHRKGFLGFPKLRLSSAKSGFRWVVLFFWVPI